MARETAADARERAARESHQATLMRIVLGDDADGVRPLVTKVNVAKVTGRADDETLVMRLYRATGPAGGVLVIEHRIPGQRTGIEVVEFEALIHNDRTPLAYRHGIEALRVARQRAVDGAEVGR